MSINMVLRRVAMCLTIAPALIILTGFAIFTLFPFMIFVAWISGSESPIREAWEMIVTDGPINMIGWMWTGTID